MPDQIDRWFLSDCEGRLEIWREAVLVGVIRDEHADITGYSTPAAYKNSDLITSWDLSTWDEGEDEDDDRRRAAYAEIVAAHNDREQLRRDLTTAQGEIEMHLALNVDLHAALDQARAVPAGQDGTA